MQHKLKALIDLLEEKEKFINDPKKAPRFYTLLVETYLEMKEFPDISKEKAIEAAKKRIEVEGERPEGYRLLGYVYYWFNDLDEAIKQTEKALQLASSSQNQDEIMNCKNNLAFYYAQIGRKEKKQIALSFAEEICKVKTIAFYLDTLGYVKMRFAEKEEEIQKAIEILNKALQLEPTDPDIMAHLREAYLKLKSL